MIERRDGPDPRLAAMLAGLAAAGAAIAMAVRWSSGAARGLAVLLGVLAATWLLFAFGRAADRPIMQTPRTTAMLVAAGVSVASSLLVLVLVLIS